MPIIENNWIYTEKRASRLTWLIPLLLALLIHLILFLTLPEQFMIGANLDSELDEEAIELTLLPPEPVTPEEMRYVEANPDAPENEPDPTDQYSFRSQQAANPEESDSPLEAPNVDGEAVDSTKILQGAVDPSPPMPSGVYTTKGEGEGNEGGQAGAHANAAVEPPTPKPAPAFLQQAPETTDGTGSTLDAIGQGETPTEQPSEEAQVDLYRPNTPTNPNQVAEQGDGHGGSPEAKPVPRARPRLSPELIHGPLAKSQGASLRRGAIALDATFSEFGEYEQQFYAALQAGWYQEIEFFQPIDTHSSVRVRFKIQSDGTIVDTEVVSSNASEIATIICETAITKRSPFRPWTKEMVKVFGDERTLTVTFHYR